MIYPSHPTPAPYHGLPLLRPFNPGYTAIFNVLGNPVTQVSLKMFDNYVSFHAYIGSRIAHSFTFKFFYISYTGAIRSWIMESTIRGSVGKKYILNTRKEQSRDFRGTCLSFKVVYILFVLGCWN